ncbi:hypothetical protein HDU97_009382 [Phlyctochytrium planicorne]|nr:hypothetical protein HDU97_009382 [Phlyctochytrium planicorne]
MSEVVSVSTVDVAEVQKMFPVWETWSPNPSEPNAVSVHSKLLQNNHTSVKKCTVNPQKARALSDLLGIPPETGFWLIPPLRAPADADVRLFSCGDRCAEAGTSLMIPEFNMGYPAARGSTVLVKKGVVYGLGVLRTDIFDQHILEGKDCCCRAVVMLRSTQEVEEGSTHEPSIAEIEKEVLGPVKALEKYATPKKNTKSQEKRSSTYRRPGPASNSNLSPFLPSGRFSQAAAKRVEVARKASGK